MHSPSSFFTSKENLGSHEVLVVFHGAAWVVSALVSHQKVLVSIPGLDKGHFCVEFACTTVHVKNVR